MWANCRLYNQDESDIVQLANHLARRFLAAWQACSLPVALAAAAPQPQPSVNLPGQPQLQASQPAAHGSVQRSSRRSLQAAQMPHMQTVANGRRAQPAALSASKHGHAEQNVPGGRQRGERLQHLASAAASKANGTRHNGLDSLPAHGDVKAPVADGVSTDKVRSVERRPSLKIMLRTAGADKVLGSELHNKQLPFRKLTVKLRASSADVRNLNPP